MESVPALPERESFRPDDPRSIAEEKVRQAAHKEQGPKEMLVTPSTISPPLEDASKLSIHNMDQRAPYFNSHVQSASKRYELKHQILSSGNYELRQVVAHWMPVERTHRVWVGENSYAELCKLIKKSLACRIR